ncbi:MAG: aspartate-semialdehyde dehydrogenase [Planctomycetota bacterium]|nr:MAG: aspartate-semialdehyde dehydrogenase [Planctomycetota bacterium]
MGYNVAIAGATGAVGIEMMRTLEAHNFPVDKLKLLASPRSAGKTLTFRGQPMSVEVLDENSFAGVDIALFSAGSGITKRYAGACLKAGALLIDNSSAFRMDPNVPLVVPEVNPDDAFEHQGIIANPNCTTIIMLTALIPLHRAWGISRIHAATYQAASGAGQAAMDELAAGTRAYLDGTPFTPQVLPHPYAFNMFAHNSPWIEDEGYCEEELKMRNESRKMLHLDDLRVHATCVRVPVLRTHAEAINVSFRSPCEVAQAYELLRQAPGVKVLEDRAANRWPMPTDVSGGEEVVVGRIRRDPTLDHTLDMWVVGDQLLKGAALNAVQIAELLIQDPSRLPSQAGSSI